MKLTRCIGALAVGAALTLCFVVGTTRGAWAKCGDGVTNAGEQCDNGTATCQLGKNAGAECYSNADCTGRHVPDDGVVVHGRHGGRL